MITKKEFLQIDEEVRYSISEILNYLKKTKPENYVLLLAVGDYKKEYDKPGFNFSPYAIDDRIDKNGDFSRLSFLTKFLNTCYSFRDNQNEIDNNEYRLHLELMTYTHIWESKAFLKKLFRLAHIANDEDYDWKAEVPDMSKHDFIRNNIRKTLENKKWNLSEVIKKGFHTSLRNAFAHSDYFFDTMNEKDRIILTNYNGAEWELDQITFNDWSKRFVYSATLSYHLYNITHEERINIEKSFGTNEFVIPFTKKDGTKENVSVYYHENGDSFAFSK